MLWVVLAFVGIVAGVAFARWRFGSTVRSLIVLFREPTFLGPQQLNRAAEATGMSLEFGADPLNFILDGHPFRLLMAPTPYGSPQYTPEQMSERVIEYRLMEVVREHKSFASFWFQDKDATKWPTALAKVGRLVAEVIDDQAIAIWRTDTNQLARIVPETIDMMRKGETEEVFGELVGDEVTQIDQDDARMRKASEQARQRWPEFVAAVKRIKDPERTIVKAPFAEGDEVEYMWINISEADEMRATGKLGSSPVSIRSVRQGDEVTVLAADISDWSYIENEELAGAFTELLVRGIKNGRTRKGGLPKNDLL